MSDEPDRVWCAIEGCIAPLAEGSHFCAGHRAEGEKRLASIRELEDATAAASRNVTHVAAELVETYEKVRAGRTVYISAMEWAKLVAAVRTFEEFSKRTLEAIEKSGRS